MKLWLWKNFVDGKPEYWAFDNPFPINLSDGDPQTLGEPCGYAIVKPSRQGRTDVSEEEVLRRMPCVTAAQPVPVQKPPCTVCGTPYEKHGSYPACASHPYTADGTCQHVGALVAGVFCGAPCPGAACKNGCARASGVPGTEGQQ